MAKEIRLDGNLNWKLNRQFGIHHLVIDEPVKHYRLPVITHKLSLGLMFMIINHMNGHTSRKEDYAVIEELKNLPEAREKIAKQRSGETLTPAPNYDIALCIYERDEEGEDADNAFLQFSRPQDFATNDAMKYQCFSVFYSTEEHIYHYLVHLYWDGTRSVDSARDVVLENADSILAQGEWEPTAPSDPLTEDDFWSEELGEPLFLDRDAEPLFDNFARAPYKRD